MISRLWHGWVPDDSVAEYSALLQTRILPGFLPVRGYKGAYVLRRESGDGETEFLVLTLFANRGAVGRFAGDDCEQACVPEAAKRLLSRHDECAVHYQLITKPRQSLVNPFPSHTPMRFIW